MNRLIATHLLGLPTLACCLLFCDLAAAQEIVPDWQQELAWVAPTENVDGTTLTDLRGYRIYWGEEPRAYDHAVLVDGVASSSYRFAPGTGRRYVAMTAVDAEGNESAFSNEIVLSVAPAPVSLAAAVLPASRSVKVGAPANTFATITNDSAEPARDCRVTTALPFPGTFSYQETDPLTNEVIGPVNPAVDISPGGRATMLMSFEVNEAQASRDVAFNFSCANSAPAPILSGVNTLTLTVSESSAPDVITLLASAQGNGVVRVPSGGSNAIGVSTVNVGSAGTLTATIDTGAKSLPLASSICEVTASGACLETPSDNVTRVVDQAATVTYSVFLLAKGDIPLDPSTNRVFVRLRDEQGVLRGSSSVAIVTQ